MSESVELLKQIVALKKGGEVRTQQETAVREIEDAILTKTSLLLEAPTGSGKTLSYLIPVIQTESTVVISTATKQLSEQILQDDIPFVRESLKKLGVTKPLNVALLKGRDNYLCLAKVADIEKLTNDANSLFGSEDFNASSLSEEGQGRVQEGQKITEWATVTKSGDRSEAPAVGDDTWRQYSSTNTECPGKSVCAFGDVCFAEYARARAKTAQIVITNHAIVAQDLANEGVLLGDREVFVMDELHEVDNYLSSAWGAELSTKRLRDAHKIFKSNPSLTESAVKDVLTCAESFPTVMKSMEVGLIDNEDTPRTLGTLLTTLYNATVRISADAARELKQANSEGAKKLLTAAKKVADELNEAASLLVDNSIETVRWTVDKNKKFVRKTIPKRGARKPAAVAPVIAAEDAVTLHAAPLRIGPKLQGFLTEREAIMIGTSATITVGRKFDIPVHNFGLDKRPHKTVELDSPFDYQKQAMFYVPAPGTFPEPTGADRAEHTAAVKKDAAEFVKAAGGRTLVLSTTAYGSNDIAESLRKDLPKMNIIAQGDAPNSQLVKYFRENETTTLVGTMGFWHGLDAPGKTCFPAGTKVRTSRGYVNIEEIEIGDLVWTHKRRYRKVTDTMIKPYKGDMIKIKPFGAEEVLVTPEHPIYVDKTQQKASSRYRRRANFEFKPAGELTAKDRLVLPTGDHFAGSKPLGMANLSGHNKGNQPTPKTWEDNAEFWELVGYWTAEGSISSEELKNNKPGRKKKRYTVTFSFGFHEEKTLATRTAYLIEKVLGNNLPTPHLYGRAAVVSVRNDAFAMWLKKNVGLGSHNKKVPTRLFRSYKPENKIAYLNAYVEGDGYIDKRDGTLSTSSVSFDLSIGIRDLALSLGYTASIYQKQAGPQAYKDTNINWVTRINTQRSRRVLIRMVKNQNKNSEQYESEHFTHQIARPHSVERVQDFEGLVYNLSVEEDESYTLIPFAVHNCSLVIIDKLPFKPMDDPLATARRNYADKTGRNGFMDVYVAEAETMFRQAFGRAIRSRSDRAVIVSFDVRLMTKNYGRGILNNLHGVRIYHDKAKVLDALKRLADS